MQKNPLSVPTWQKGCIEEMVILNETKEVLKYSFSNSLDNIRTAIYARTGHNINLEKAVWKQNTRLSISVKHLMNFHNVNYSMTTDAINDEKYVAVNMRVGDKWYLTGYDEIDGKFYAWQFLDMIKLFRKLNDKLSEDSDI
jgi:hypothetical protein